jgi:hypothetical protein
MYTEWPQDLLSSADVTTDKGNRIRVVRASLIDLGEDPLANLECDSWWIDKKFGILAATFGATDADVKSLWTSRFGSVGLGRDVLFRFRSREQRIHRPVVVEETRSTLTLCFLPAPASLTEHGNVIVV